MKKQQYIVSILFVLISFLIASPLWSAPITVKITKWVEDSYPVAVVPFVFSGKHKPDLDVVTVINKDLLHSGKFNPYPRESYDSIPDLQVKDPASKDEINFKGWRIVGQEALVVGSIAEMPDRSYEIRFYIYDVFKSKYLGGNTIKSTSKQLRSSAHIMADIIYEQLTGQKGAFSTMIAFVTKDVGRGGEDEYALWLADWDGENRQQLRASHYPYMSPAWSPDGNKLAYASLEQSGSQRVFVEDWRKRRRTIITTTHLGLYGAPAWSPDGKYLAIAITRHGNADIYKFNIDTKHSQKLTSNSAIDTEPVWSHDGKSIIFTSDRSGLPQLYSMSSNGGNVNRLTYNGTQNLKATVSPDGKNIAMVHQVNGGYKVATMSLKTGRVTVLTDGKLDESPSYAPNGSMIIYSTSAGDAGTTLATMSEDGGFEYVFNYSGDVREPAWSPFGVK